MQGGKGDSVGQAKLRGTFEERKKQAIEAERIKRPIPAKVRREMDLLDPNSAKIMLPLLMAMASIHERKSI